MPARQPATVDLVEQLKAEAVAQAPRLADLAFGKDAFTDSKNVPRPEYLEYIRHSWINGLTMPDGTQLEPEAWRQKLLDRVGEDRFWDDAHAAFGLSPAESIRQLKLAQAAPEVPLPDPNLPVEGAA